MTALMWLSKQFKSFSKPEATMQFPCTELSHLALVSLCLKLHTNSHQKLNLDYSAYTQTKLLSWEMSIQTSTCFSMPQGLLGMQLGVSTLCTHASPDSLPSTSHTKDFRVVQNTTTDNDKQCVKLHIIDKTKQKGSFNLWSTSKQWLVNGKMNFFFLVSRQSQVPWLASNSLCSWRWFWLSASLASIPWVLGLQTCATTLGL